MALPQSVSYEVELFVDGEIADDYVDWLRGHVAELLQIDGFLGASIQRRERLDEDAEAEQVRLCVRYDLRDREAFERYLREDAKRFRGDALRRFGKRFFAERSLLSAAEHTIQGEQAYAGLTASTRALFEDERDALANMANFTALLWAVLPRINWVGFYLKRGDELILGPFQGKIACVRIPMGRGVCGTAAACRESLVVGDVRAFEGHIACDADSRSEIVIPVIVGGELVGVLDVDSPIPSRFDLTDCARLEAAIGVLVERSSWDTLQNGYLA
jgi:GAF domain-containing protein